MNNKFCPEYNVIVWDDNKNSPKSWNIYYNTPFRDAAIRAVRKYDRAPCKFNKQVRLDTWEYEVIYGWDAFVETIRSLLMWQFWARCEYELVVSEFPTSSIQHKEYKVDVYTQCVSNVEGIARLLLYEYRKWKRSKRSQINDTTRITR